MPVSDCLNPPLHESHSNCCRVTLALSWEQTVKSSDAGQNLHLRAGIATTQQSENQLSTFAQEIKENDWCSDQLILLLSNN